MDSSSCRRLNLEKVTENSVARGEHEQSINSGALKTCTGVQNITTATLVF